AKDSLLHYLDLAGVVYLDVRPLLLADHHSTHTDGLAVEVGSRVVDSRLAEFRPSTLGDDHTQVFGVTMVRLGVQEALPGTGAALRPLDKHFHRDRLVHPVDGFNGGEIHPILVVHMRAALVA